MRAKFEREIGLALAKAGSRMNNGYDWDDAS
jgi:hypothetical protein